MTNQAIGALRRRMIEDMAIRKLASVTGWNTTARQRTMQVTACTSFSIAPQLKTDSDNRN
jgi:hypothetical protein